MYQESEDKLRGSVLSDTVLFIVLIISFFVFGGIAALLRAKFDTPAPLYIFALIFGAALYVVYKLRIVGYRYTVFYKEPETEYDPRFDDYITHEDYPYPVGTVVIEKTVSAKGTIVEVIRKEELVAVLAPGESHAPCREKVYCPRSKDRCSSVVFKRDGEMVRAYIAASEEFRDHVKTVIEG